MDIFTNTDQSFHGYPKYGNLQFTHLFSTSQPEVYFFSFLNLSLQRSVHHDLWTFCSWSFCRFLLKWPRSSRLTLSEGIAARWVFVNAHVRAHCKFDTSWDPVTFHRLNCTEVKLDALSCGSNQFHFQFSLKELTMSVLIPLGSKTQCTGKLEFCCSKSSLTV